MDFPSKSNHSFSLSPQHNGSISELLSLQNIEGDENSEWLSVYVEDCLSSPRNYGLASLTHSVITKSSNQNPPKTLKTQPMDNSESSVRPAKGRKKKRRSCMKFKTHKAASLFGLDCFNLGPEIEFEPDPYPPLLQQSHWLADSELIFPIKPNSPSKDQSSIVDKEMVVDISSPESESFIEPKSHIEKKKVSKTRRCTHCQADKTPLWRQGPLGKGTLCNACGVRWLKTGTLFPEYRPANSPTFVNNVHSNILRKVLKMREARQSSGSGEE